MKTRATLLILALGLVSCGEPLATGDYLGEPLIRVEGTIYLEDGGQFTPANLSVGLFWTNDLTAQWLDDSAANVNEQNAVVGGTFPARYSVTFYEPPGPEVLKDVPDTEGAIATALILVYSDVNGDGRLNLTENEPVVGGSLKYVLGYVPAPFSSEHLGGEVSQGYHLLRILPPEQACEDDFDLAALRPADEGLNVDLIVGPDVRDQLPDLDCDGIRVEWRVADCGAIVVAAIKTEDPTLWDQYTQSYLLCLSVGDDQCATQGNAVFAQSFRARDDDVANAYLECSGLLEPNPCQRFETLLESVIGDERQRAFAGLASCAKRNDLCELLDRYAQRAYDELNTARVAVRSCLGPILTRGTSCAETYQEADARLGVADELLATLEDCLGTGSEAAEEGRDCTPHLESFEAELTAVARGYRVVSSCAPAEAECTDARQTRDTTDTERAATLTALEACTQDPDRTSCRAEAAAARQADATASEARSTYERCLVSNAGTACTDEVSAFSELGLSVVKSNELRVGCRAP
jgi:hypothetical protein